MKNGFLLIDKEEKVFTQDLDREIRHLFHQKKVGHLGTLDPFATGLVILGLGEATKLFPLLENGWKQYTATLTLGADTDTLDYTGKVIETREIRPFTEADVRQVLVSFLGKSRQVPPKYSAVHIDGKRAYELAYQGKDFTLPTKEIEVRSIELVSLKGNDITFRCEVSKGTYIRSLAKDIAFRLFQNLGHLSFLRRTAIGPYKVDDAIPLERVDGSNVLDMVSFLGYPNIIVDEDSLLKKIRNGNEVRIENIDSPYVFFSNQETPLALYRRKEENIYTCYKGFHYETKPERQDR